MRVINVESCADCPHFGILSVGDASTEFCYHESREIENIEIPEWCPLDEDGAA